MRCLLTLIALGVFVPAGIKAQSTVVMKTTVSETVTLSAQPGNVNVASRGANAVEITLSGDEIIRVPLLVRSNSNFKISAISESKTAVLSELSIEDVRATGTLVEPQIVGALHLNPQLDPDTSQPLLVLTGPRVSLGGTLTSPNNALQITVLIRLKPGSSRESHLTFVATPE
jgi:hypothetical protein